MAQQKHTELTAQVVAAFVANNQVPASALADLIGSTFASISNLGSTIAPAEEVVDPLRPAVPIKKSVTNEYIICLEDGKRFKSLTRHLSAHYNLSPAEYRERWGLSSDYPMVAPDYAARRSELAKAAGLGKKNGAGRKVKGG